MWYWRGTDFHLQPEISKLSPRSVLYQDIQELIYNNMSDGAEPPKPDELRIFYSIDRELYVVLVRDLCRDPFESLHIMGLWQWFEQKMCRDFVSKTLALSPGIVDCLADEALTCLAVIRNTFPSWSGSRDISLTSTLLERKIDLMYFCNNQTTIYHGYNKLVSNVYIPALSDLMERARYGGFVSRARPPSPAEGLTANFSKLTATEEMVVSTLENEMTGFARTMYAIFEEDNPVTDAELRLHFTQQMGNCIEAVHMQEESLGTGLRYARIRFLRLTCIPRVLNRESVSLVSVNGKRVWMVQYMLRVGRDWLPCGCPAVGPSSCPHHQDYP